MDVNEGSVILINLICGCCEKRITLMRGRQQIQCPHCRKRTDVDVYVNKGIVTEVRVT